MTWSSPGRLMRVEQVPALATMSSKIHLPTTMPQVQTGTRCKSRALVTKLAACMAARRPLVNAQLRPRRAAQACASHNRALNLARRQDAWRSHSGRALAAMKTNAAYLNLATVQESASRVRQKPLGAAERLPAGR